MEKITIRNKNFNANVKYRFEIPDCCISGSSCEQTVILFYEDQQIVAKRGAVFAWFANHAYDDIVQKNLSNWLKALDILVNNSSARVK
jgi:hypothetical protein